MGKNDSTIKNDCMMQVNFEIVRKSVYFRGPKLALSKLRLKMKMHLCPSKVQLKWIQSKKRT